MRRRGELSGSFPGRCCACVRLPILAPLLKYPQSRSPEVALAFLQNPGTHPSEGPAAPSPCPRQLRCQRLGFPSLLGPAWGCREGLELGGSEAAGTRWQEQALVLLLSGSWCEGTRAWDEPELRGSWKNAE